MPDPRAHSSFAAEESILTAIEQGFASGAASVTIERAGLTRTIRIVAARGCATRFQAQSGSALNAHANGRDVQVTTALAQYAAADDELAAVMAHEFAHNLLHHFQQLHAPGVHRGGGAERRTEEEADRLSVYLLDRAGYDPGAVARFWRRLSHHGLNFLGSASHGSWGQRIAAVEEEIANLQRMKAEGRRPLPTFMTARRSGE